MGKLKGDVDIWMIKTMLDEAGKNIHSMYLLISLKCEKISSPVQSLFNFTVQYCTTKLSYSMCSFCKVMKAAF